MRITMKFSLMVVIVIISVTVLIVHYINQKMSYEVVKEKSEQEKIEEFAEKMKPKIEERLHEEDIYKFIKTITFEKNVTISPMGYITVDGYINDEPEKFHFSASLRYRFNEISSMSHSPDLSDRFIDWNEYKDEPKVKENFLKSFTVKEREQYLEDIGEKE
ncbi:DUF1433 domain-containing protein [Bacillus safensis]|uniref:DUF1433 domain-containing protein n=1 Tax=Bacillus safensis TaxID=561879 RepID=UPI00203F7FF4|nr:DUF1433 domain-containing protein [Bacillus safensis]MCM2989191.1 DUF1433 domain-containing protein [Bacillus safensis]